jgi:hypothetical protein
MDIEQRISVRLPDSSGPIPDLIIELMGNTIRLRHVTPGEGVGDPDKTIEIILPFHASAELVIAFQNIHNEVRNRYR